MPGFPVLAKIWQAPIIVTLPQESTVVIQHGKAVVGVKNAFLAPAVSPWVLKGCSNSVSSNMVGTDLLIDNTNIIPSTSGAHSWFVLRNQVTGQEFCVDFSSADVFTILTAMSVAAGFTGGSTTARPTATDEATIGASNTWLHGFAGVARMKVVLLHSTDGKVTYCFVLYQGFIISAWCFGEMTSHHTAWSPPLIGFLQGANALGNSSLNTITRLNTTDEIMARAASGTMMLRTTSHYAHGNRVELTETARESPTGKWQFWSIGLACVNSPRRGRHGTLLDIYRVPNSIPPGWIFRSDDGVGVLMSIGSGWAIPWSANTPPAIF